MSRIPETFILRAIQEWGQSDDDRRRAVQGVLDAAGFNATATCGPVFGRIWPKLCDGPDGELASAWLKELTDTMPRGRFEDEAAHVAAAIDKATAPVRP